MKRAALVYSHTTVSGHVYTCAGHEFCFVTRGGALAFAVINGLRVQGQPAEAR